MKPNIIIFVSDQWRGDFTGSADHPVVRTPNYDRMAEEGMVFNRPVQNSVSRSMILCLYHLLYHNLPLCLVVLTSIERQTKAKTKVKMLDTPPET